MPQEQHSQSMAHDDQHEDGAAIGVGAAREAAASAAIDDLDAILDDIGAVLETNAEEYVSGFVQKGGQ